MDPRLGWEAAVFDHYQAVATAIAAKTRTRVTGAVDNGFIGGSTLHFGIDSGHPYESRVLGTLGRIREELNVLWNEVAAYNREHPLSDDAATRVTFYFGQHVRTPDEAGAEVSGSDVMTKENETP